MTEAKRPKDIDTYISQFPADVQAILKKVQQTISQAAPDAKETIIFLEASLPAHDRLPPRPGRD